MCQIIRRIARKVARWAEEDMQCKNGLVADGIVGIKTWKKILGVK